jgi:Mrp family chromosome partitioning ATPase
MSKIQSTIEKAIEKHRSTKEPGAGDRVAPRRQKIRGDAIAVASGVFRRFHFVTPLAKTMEESRIVSAVDDRIAKSAYNVLRTRVLQRMRSNNCSSILGTSLGPGEGKTLTAANLALSLSRDVNQSAVLVDLDLTRSSIAKYLGVEIDIKSGIGDYLLGNAEFSEVIYTLGEIDRLALVPNREPVENASDLLGNPRTKELVARLREQSENTVVIYDMPPVLACDDVLAFCTNVDAILLVAAQGKTDRAALEQTITMLSENELLGVVLNMSGERAGDGSYAYY